MPDQYRGRCSQPSIGQSTGSPVKELENGLKELENRLKELKGFKKVELNPSQTKVVKFEITPDDLKFFDDKAHEWIAEPGKFKVYIGSSSTDIKSTLQFSYK